MKATYKKHVLEFKRAAGTSRGVLLTKEAWYIILKDDHSYGIGECGLLRGLSIDDRSDYEAKLSWVCDHIDQGVDRLYSQLTDFPSIQIGLETAFKSFASSDPFQLFPSAFSKGKEAVPINGLIWMGDSGFMKEQISEKLKQGFQCIKMKIGAIDFSSEMELLRNIRREFSATEIELRVDANGAFKPAHALEKLKQLSELELHSIEQPIKAGQWTEMAALCEKTPLPIALDEELIGVSTSEEKIKMLNAIQPQFIILKPSFIGGFQGSDDWISKAEERGIGWWITSALESNVGLNAISQYTFTKNSKLPQGLGTGSLYTNNIQSPLEVANGTIAYNANAAWDLSPLKLTY